MQDEGATCAELGRPLCREHGNPNVVEQHISNLRDRVDRGCQRPLLHTVRGVGYVLRDDGHT